MTTAEKSYKEQFTAKKLEARERGAKRRSENTRPRTLDEVRATVQDAAIQVGRYGVRERRAELRVVKAVIEDLRTLVSVVPRSRVEMVAFLSQLERHALTRMDGVDDEGAPEYGLGPWPPSMTVHVDHHGLQQLQNAVADRIQAGALPPHPPKPADVVDFAAAAERLRPQPDDDDEGGAS